MQQPAGEKAVNSCRSFLKSKRYITGDEEAPQSKGLSLGLEYGVRCGKKRRGELEGLAG